MLYYQNTIDGRLYLFDKGPTSTTVSASPKTITEGRSVLIEGSVLDQSPGKPGTPAIADEYMSEWMQYLYNNAEMPADAEGVSVKLYAIDPNNNYQDIGVVTTDIWGNFGTSWEPPVPGDYFIVAEFEGTESYWDSSDSTYLTVDPAPAEPEPEPEPEEPLFTTAELAILAAVVILIIIAIIGIWILRKR